MGGGKGDSEYTMMPGWPGAKPLLCYPFMKVLGLGERTSKTMGLQMINHPSWGLSDDEKPLYTVNAEVKYDLFVVALRDIEEGEELFISYNTGEYASDGEGGKKDGKSRTKDGKTSDGEGKDDGEDGGNRV